MNKDERRQAVEDRIREISRELQDTAQIAKDLEAQRKQKAGELKNLQNTLAQLKAPRELEVTDHAVLRYAERHYGLNVEQLRAEIAAIMESTHDIGSLQFEGFIVKNNTVVTYVGKAS